jgi:hypothetical protein
MSNDNNDHIDPKDQPDQADLKDQADQQLDQADQKDEINQIDQRDPSENHDPDASVVSGDGLDLASVLDQKPDDAATDSSSEHQNPVYMGLYLIGPLLEPRGPGQEPFSLSNLENPYPPELEDAIAERAAILARLEIVRNQKKKKGPDHEEIQHLLQNLGSFDRRLSLRWERLRSNHLKLAKSFGERWVVYLTSLNQRHRFLARNIVSLRNQMEQTTRHGPRNTNWLLQKSMLDLQKALPEITALTEETVPKVNRSPAMRKMALNFLAVLEKERLAVLDRILIAEKGLIEASTQTIPLAEPAPDPVSVPQMSTKVNMPSRNPGKSLKTLTLVTVGLLAAVILFFFGYRWLNSGPQPNKPGRILVYNGLSSSVTITLEGEDALHFGPGMGTVIYEQSSSLRVNAYLTDGLPIETVTLKPPSQADLETTLIYNVGGSVPLVEWLGSGPLPENSDPAEFLPLGAPRVFYSRAHVFFPKFRSNQNPILLWSPPRQAKNYLAVGAVTALHPDLVLGALKGGQNARNPMDTEVRNLITSQARLSPNWDPWAPLWGIGLAQRDPQEALEVMLLRQSMYLNENWSRKLLFDLSDEPTKAEFCQETVARVAMDQENIGDQYMLTFCLPKTERISHLSELMEQYPRDYWLVQAMGREQFDLGHYVEACRLWKIVLASQPASLVFDLEDLARLEHYLGATNFEIYDEINPWAPEMGRILALEAGSVPNKPQEELSPDQRAYYLLGQGEPGEALKSVSSGSRSAFLPLAAASDGADPELILEIMAQDPENGLTRNNAWTKLALAINNGQDTAKIEEYILALAKDKGLLAELIKLIKAQDSQKIRPLLTDLSARQIGEVCLAVVLTGEDHLNCREKAKGFLFVSERPYLK